MRKIDKMDINNERQNLSHLASSQQFSAANPNISVWVEASAGTGKTKVLSDRVLRLLLNSDDPHPERILCLTYTKAGAMEMKSRIYERLSEWSVMSDENLQQSLSELFSVENITFSKMQNYKKRARVLFAILLDTTGGMKIQTIHSFCQDLLSRFPIESGISPYFEIIENEEQTDILEQIRNDLIVKAENDSKSSTSRYMRYITENMKESNFSKAIKEIIENREKLQNIFNYYHDFSDFENKLADKIGADKTKLTADIYNDFMHSLSGKLDIIVETLRHGTEPEKRTADVLQNIIKNGYSAQYFEDLQKIFLKTDGDLKTIGTKDSRAYNPNITEQAEKISMQIAETSKKIARQRLFFSSQAIFGLAHELFSLYAEYKNKRAKLDYGDLIFYANRLLSNSASADWVLYKLDGGIDHILVDEAQDTSPEQWNIIKALSEEFFAGRGSKREPCTVFVVGDCKQSIFSFQGADPQKMEEMLKYFSAKSENNFEKINLDISFRSTSAVLDIVNKVFSFPEANSGVTSENEQMKHLPYRIGELGRVEIWPLMIKEKQNTSDNDKAYLNPQKTPSVKYRLAQKIVAKIKELMEKSQNTPRPLHFGDFMILVQKRAHFINEFIRACKEGNVSVSGADRIKLSEQIAVQDLISLAKFLLLPNDDLSLAEVLKSPLFNFTDDDLFKLCWNRGSANLWSKLRDYSEYHQTYEELQNLCNQIDFVRPYELFCHVLSKMGGRRKFILRMGYEVEDALDEFMNMLLNFERDHIPSMQNFVEWISNHEIEIKREAKQNDIDAVRLMTVHGSKGLQARVVFLPDTTHSNKLINEQKLLIDEKQNIAFYPLNKEYFENNSLKINQQITQKEDEESRRLLYVALTRAEDELYICGFSGSSKGADKGSWYELCKSAFREQGKEQSDGNMVYEIKGEVLPSKKSIIKTSEKSISAENWIFRNAETEIATSKPYTPSKLDSDDEDSVSPLADNGNFYKRGTVIHKMLQFLPQTDENRAQIMQRYLEESGFSYMEAEQIADEVSKVLNNPAFSDIFGKNSRAEVPIMGEIEGKIISAQIDRLIIFPDKIKIVDFKTNRRVDEIPPSYINQLNVYAQLISKIYPNKQVETYILWTNSLKLTRIS